MTALVRIMMVLLPLAAEACTNFMVSPGASADGATIMSYSCDGPPFAMLTHYPAQPAHSKRELKRRGCAEEGESRGEIEEEKRAIRALATSWNSYFDSSGHHTSCSSCICCAREGVLFFCFCPLR